MVDEHEDDADRDRDLPRTTTTGDEGQDYRQPGDSAVQSSERNDPRTTDPDSTGHSEDDDLLPDVDADRDEEQEDLGEIERPAGHITDRPYGET